MAFEEDVYKKLKAAIESWSQDEVSKTYAISFFIYDEEDDPRYPTLTLGYNTTDELDDSATEESKWNYAFWPQTCEAFIGEGDEVERCKAWLRELGLWYVSEDEETDDIMQGDHLYEDSIDEAALAQGEKITQAYVELAVRTAQRLHTEGVITTVYGKTIPILIHELEYYRDIAAQTERANPPGVSQEFTDWIEGMYDIGKKIEKMRAMGVSEERIKLLEAMLRDEK